MKTTTTTTENPLTMSLFFSFLSDMTQKNRWKKKRKRTTSITDAKERRVGKRRLNFNVKKQIRSTSFSSCSACLVAFQSFSFPFHIDFWSDQRDFNDAKRERSDDAFSFVENSDKVVRRQILANKSVLSCFFFRHFQRERRHLYVFD